MSEYREFEGRYMKPADAGYGCPEPRQMDPRKGKRMRRIVRMMHGRVRSRQKSRKGLGRREYR